MIELKDDGTYVRRDGVVVTVASKQYPCKEYSKFCFIAGGWWYMPNGRVYESEESDFDIISEYQPPFTIAAGNYYRTRDGRKAYVACGPVTTPLGKERGSEELLYGFIDEPSKFKCEWWEPSGASDSKCHPLHADDLVAPWHPETLTDPTTGKKYRVAEEVT